MAKNRRGKRKVAMECTWEEILEIIEHLQEGELLEIDFGEK